MPERTKPDAKGAGRDSPPPLEVLIVGATRYRPELDPGLKKKFQGLAESTNLTIVAFSFGLRFEQFQLQENVRFHLAPHLPLAALRLLLLAGLTFRVGGRWIGKPDGRARLVLSEDPFVGILGLFLKRAARRRGASLVMETETHGDWERAPAHYFKFLRFFEPLLRAWGRFVLRRADIVRTVSVGLKRRVEALVSSEVPVFVFPTFTDLDLFLEPAQREEPPPVFLFVGTLSPVKGISILLEAFDALRTEHPESRLRLAGDGPLRRALEKEIRGRKLDDRVTLLGSLSQVELRDELDRSLGLVLPSLSEGLPRVALEAMARERPVVASRVGGLPEVVEEGERGFLVPAGDASALKEKMQYLVENRDEARRMGERGRVFVERGFSVDGYFSSYRELFDRARRLASTDR